MTLTYTGRHQRRSRRRFRPTKQMMKVLAATEACWQSDEWQTHFPYTRSTWLSTHQIACTLHGIPWPKGQDKTQGVGRSLGALWDRGWVERANWYGNKSMWRISKEGLEVLGRTWLG